MFRLLRRDNVLDQQAKGSGRGGTEKLEMSESLQDRSTASADDLSAFPHSERISIRHLVSEEIELIV